MSYPPLPSNGEINWGTKFTTWANALEGRKVEGTGLALRRDTTVGTRVFLDFPGGSTMIHGDTGWRDVTPTLPDRKMTAGQIIIRRVNSTLMVWLSNIMLNEVSGPQTVVVFSSVPGMTPSGSVRTTFDISDIDIQSTDEIMVYGSPASMIVRWMSRKSPTGRTDIIPAFPKPRSGIMFFNIAGEAWPTSIPGTPA